MGFIQKYTTTLEYVGWEGKAPLLIGGGLAGSAIAIILSTMFFDPVMGFLIALALIDLAFGLPFFKADKKLTEMEDKLPDVLGHMSTTLKTGGTIEMALREVSKMDYGPITPGMRKMLKNIREGITFEEAFRRFGEETRSDLIQKVATIIISARKSGGALTETLSALSQDIRAVARLKRERKTKTFMQFLFLITAGVIVAPLVFGIVHSVLMILIKSSATGAAAATGLAATYDFLFKTYILVESSLTMMGAVMIREGKLSRSVLYIPIGAIAAYIIYVFVAAGFMSFIAGGGMVGGV